MRQYNCCLYRRMSKTSYKIIDNKNDIVNPITINEQSIIDEDDKTIGYMINHILMYILEWLNQEKLMDLWDLVLIFSKSSPERKIISVFIHICIAFFIVKLIKRIHIY